MLLQFLRSQTIIRRKRKLNKLPSPDPFILKNKKTEEQRLNDLVKVV